MRLTLLASEIKKMEDEEVLFKFKINNNNFKIVIWVDFFQYASYN